MLVARSDAMRALDRALGRVAKSELPVLIEGETGSGKELVARAIHEESDRARCPFVALDLAAVPAGLIDVELFGAREGAYTDLGEDRPGVLGLAAGGTVLIDEITHLDLDAQAKLLRVLSERRYRPIGETATREVEARFLFATSVDPGAALRAGTLRADLLHRVRVLEIVVPALRDRPEDVAELAERFLRDGRVSPPSLDPGAIERLRRHHWPGNVRELENVIARLALENPERISLDAVSAALGDTGVANSFPRNLLAASRLGELEERLAREYLLFHLERLGGDTNALSRFVGIGRQQLYRRLRKLGVRLRSPV
jgi:DNA-binding NtrC family response regulator